jgi:hypothetical protein
VGYTTPTGSRMVRFGHDHMGRLVRLTGPAGAADTTRLFYGTASRLDSLWLPSASVSSSPMRPPTSRAPRRGTTRR